MVPPDLPEANLTQGTARIAVNGKAFGPFLRYQLGSHSVRANIYAVSKGSTFTEISLADLRKIRVLLPPLPEQKKIAEILSTWDRAIETVEALLATARTQKRALMQTLLTGKRRFPEFEGQEWREVPLNKISEPVSDRNSGNDIPVLTISSKAGFVRQDDKYSRNMAGKSVERYYHLREGEFAYNKGNSLTYPFGCVLRLDEYAEGLVPHVYVCFRLKDGCNSDFYRGLFLADYLKPQLSRLVNTGVRNNGLLNISPSAFWTVTVPVPPLQEQEKIGRVMADCLDEERRLVANIDKLRTEKRALMQQLMTGKRRVALE
ncbi:type I restriction endonuclease subunit S [Sulfitobacter sp. HI0040]|nr:type I restriction endonuclease subunit S [Sulfitobacter sp. HI0023]KZY23995.1 type I restriction endonuclease subunit S [Sulfitobacter sp. HI0040]KZZ62885.1 type I restriction endonuclease subunit S [Sulfitobacter sp. HI0129]